MSKHLARDSCVWNMMLYGKPRKPVAPDEMENDADTYLDEKLQQEFHKPSRISRKGVRMVQITTFFLIFILMMLRKMCDFKATSLVSDPRLQTLSLNEGIQVSYPYIPKSSYGKPVYSTVLVDHVFGNSWGAPSANYFNAPKNITFNKVVLTLTTSVDHVQYDRLAHLYVGGAEIWRTSTIEPGGHLRTSSFKKDVTPYLSLFQQKTEVLFQLDNIVNEGLKGEFHIVLSADFYYEHDLEEEVSSHKHFSMRKAASKVYPLVQGSYPPVASLPDDNFLVKLPQVSKNTTRLRLSIFTSGNGNEEFWYTNVVDSYVDSFKGKVFGHGPQRYVNVYFNGVKVATQVPQPVIFTGGISPSLWNPIVSIDAFDLKSIDLDLSVLLPALWESADNYLSVEVASSVEPASSSIGLNWITSANILTYENSAVLDASGLVGVPVEVPQHSNIVLSPPGSGFLSQILTGSLLIQVESLLNFTLESGKVLQSKVGLNTTGSTSHVGIYREYGNNQKIVQVGENKKSLWFEDATNQTPPHELATTVLYPLVLSLEETDNPGDIVYDAKIVTHKHTKVKVDGVKALKIKTYQNGSSIFHVSPNGNHGTGALRSGYNLTMHEPFGEFKYRRVVDAEDGEITKDIEITEGAKDFAKETAEDDYIGFDSSFFREYLGSDFGVHTREKSIPMRKCHFSRDKKFRHLIHSFR